MPVAVSYPGVYIQEIPSGARAIAGVPTSVAAFVGYTAQGPTNEPVQIFSYADFQRRFGGLHLDSVLAYTVNHFFLNGGAIAWIVRVAEGAVPAEIVLQTEGGTDTLRVEAAAEGTWGNNVVLVVDQATTSPASSFNLTVTELVEQNGRLVPARSEVHRNLSMNPNAANYAVTAVGADSDLVVLGDLGAPVGSAVAESGPADVSLLGDDVRTIALSINGGPVRELDLFDEGLGGAVTTLADVAQVIQDHVVDELGFAGFTCAGPAAATGTLTATLPAAPAPNDRITAFAFRNATVRNASPALGLGLANGGREAEGAAQARPAPSGTRSDRLPDFDDTVVTAGNSLTVELRDAAATVVDDATVATFAAAPATLSAVRAVIETALRSSLVPAIAQARVDVIDDALVLRPGANAHGMHFTFTGAAATELELSTGNEHVNVATYALGVGPTFGAQSGAVLGVDGTLPSPATIMGTRAAKSGIFALEDVDLFNILMLPGVGNVAALTAAVVYAEERRSMVIVDLDANIDTLDEARDWVNDPANSGLKHPNAVAYFPQVRLADPLQNGRLRSFPNSGVMAGLWSRTDATRRVWKAPAGIEAVLRGVQALAYTLSDPENGVLNPLGLNCLRTFPVYGTVAWGARTLFGADARASEWKYVPVRRVALFIEESLYRGTQFAVFEPNDEPLWAQIRLAVGSFMQNLFRQGAFQGATPQDAYFVRCDASTTTQADIDLGIVNVEVGFAPLKPAEFVIIRIQQIAGQGQ